MEKSLNTPIRYFKGVGPERMKLFNKLGINTAEDLLYYFPRRYEDRTNFVSVAKLQEGQVQTIKAKVLVKSERRSLRRRRFTILEVAVGDDTGKVSCVWFNQPYLKEYFKAGREVILYGKVERYGAKLQINSPEFEFVSEGVDESLSTGRIVPVYSLPEGLTQRTLRKMLFNALDEYLGLVNDFLPYDVRSRNNLLNLAKSLRAIHFPENFDIQKEAYRRLSFEEFLLFQLPLALRKLRKKEKQGISHTVEGKFLSEFVERLPFRLTASQEKVIAEIKSDLSLPQPMQRLLQGDVGSGKTVVATIASLCAIQGGYQVAFMVPTEILARQHYEKIKNQISKIKDKEIKLGLLVGSIPEKDKDRLCRSIAENKINFIIGTHALLEEDVRFKNLGLVVIDEQHKFGVGQRALLPKRGLSPDVLIMTATPIPRTLAITLYADLDISIIKELPSGRLPITTMHFGQDEQKKAYQIVQGELDKGSQAFIVYPVIEESYALDIAGAKKMYEQLKAGVFKASRLGLIHGRLPQKEQDATMSKFQNKDLDVLVSTTVLEVGIDIPNATCMIVEHAERFGLAQLHQLRGRVGRGERGSFCILISDAETQQAKARLKAMVTYSDGFRIAEEDLKIRGPGEFFGSRQHGLTELRIANPLTQLQLLKRAREEALRLVSKDPMLDGRQNTLLKEKLLQRFPEYKDYHLIG